MKKLLISLTVVVAMLCSMGGMVYAEEAKGLLNQLGGAEFVPGSVPAQISQVESMVPPVNAMVMCMVEQDLDYDETSRVFLWNSLYYMISLCGEMDSRAEFTDETMILPTEAVEDYAAALFADYHGLPELPRDLEERVSYDPQQDCYHLARGDAGLCEAVIEEVQTWENGGLEVTGALVSLEDGSVLCRFTADLLENNLMFGYAIADMRVY